MKKTEAISILATSVRPREAKDRERYDEAVGMAIEALKCSETPKSSERASETAQADHTADIGKKAEKEDCISRQAAIDALKDMYRAAEKWLRDATDDVTKARAESCMATLVEIKLRIDKTMGKGTLTDDDCMEAAKSVLGEDELPAVQPERKKPVFKTGESVYHVSYADGTGGFEKNKWADWTCPDCGWFVGEQYIPRRRNQQKCNYCAKCGCAIDWSDADMRGGQDG